MAESRDAKREAYKKAAKEVVAAIREGATQVCCSTQSHALFTHPATNMLFIHPATK